MESFYSIIYYKTNPLTDEMLSVGLLAGGGQGPYLFISKARMDVLKKVLHPNTYLSVKRHFKALKEKVNSHKGNSQEMLLFDPVFSKEQLDKLSKRTKNAIVYSTPITLNEWLDNELFNNLIKSFFGEEKVPTKIKRSIFHIKWKAYYRSNKFDSWEKEIELKSLVPEAISSIRLDLISEEENSIIKGIDFDSSRVTLNKRVAEIALIRKYLSTYQLTIVHPTPKTKNGKETLSTLSEDKNVKYITFKQFISER